MSRRLVTFHLTLKILFKPVWNLDLKGKAQKLVHILKEKSAGLSPQFIYHLSTDISLDTFYMWLTTIYINI